MSGRSGGPWQVLEEARRRVRADATLTVALAALAIGPVILMVGWAIGDGWGMRTVGPLVLVAVGIGLAAALVVVLVRLWIRPLTDAAIIAAAERARGLPEGSLRGVVELSGDLPPGVSAALFRKSARDVGRRLQGSSAGELTGDLGLAVRSRRKRILGVVAALALLTTAAAFGTPERARAGWGPLLHPVAHARGPALAPLTVGPGDVGVPRGETLEVTITAPSRTQVTLEWQAAGDVPRRERLVVRNDRADGSIGPVDAATTYRVRAPDGAVSGPYRAIPIDPLLLASFGIELVYPAHLAREAERIEEEVPALSVPEGTLLRIRASATRPLDQAIFRRTGGGERVAEAKANAFSLDWRVGPGDGGLWELALRDEGGTEAVATAVRIAVDRDAPPRVRIVVPGTDTLMPPTLRQPIVADAVDDHGLVAAAMVYRRISAGGQRGPAVRSAIELPPGQDRVLLRAILDVSGERLSAGDAIEYHLEVRDNAPGGQVGRSGTYQLRLPSMAMLREQARRQSADLVDRLDAAAARSRELDRATRDLARRGATGGPAPTRQRGASPTEASSLEFDRARELGRIASEHEDVGRELRALRDQLERLQTAIDQAGLRDAELQQRLDQIRELQNRLGLNDHERAAEALREAAERLDPEAAAAAIEALVHHQEALRRHMEETLALLERAAADQEMAALAREAEEIAAEQELLAAAMREELGKPQDPRTRPEDPGDARSATRDSALADDRTVPRAEGAEENASGGGVEDDRASERNGTNGEDGASEPGSDAADRRAKQQEELEDRTERLTGLLESLQRQLLQLGDSESASQAGSAREKGESAQESMRDAADQARQNDGDAAAASGERAAGDISDAAQALNEARGGQGQARQAQVQQAVEEATQDALRLAAREEALRQQMEEAQAGGGMGAQQGGQLHEIQSEQAAVRQGLEQLGRNLAETAEQTGPMDREVAQALARAMLDMDRTMEGLRTGGSMPTREAARTVESLNRLAMALLEQDERARPDGRPATDQALQRLAELAREQAALNAQVGAFAPLDLPGRVQDEQLRQMAEAQRGIARRAGEVSGLLGGQEDVLGRVDELAVEGAAIARELDGGRLDPDVRARQERLFHRLLDAGRSLEREEYTDERVGEVASALEALSPEALDAGALEFGLRFPGPTTEQLQGLPAAYRRLVLEYFDRLNVDAGLNGEARGQEERR